MNLREPNNEELVGAGSDDEVESNVTRKKVPGAARGEADIDLETGGAAEEQTRK